MAPLTGIARTRAGALVLFTLALYVTTAGGSLTTSDAVFTFDVAKNLVEHRSVATSPELGQYPAYQGTDGRYYSPFGIMQSLFDVPFYAVGRQTVTWTGLRVGRADSVPKAVVALAQTLVATGLVYLVFALSLAVTDAPGPSLMAAVTMAVGSLIWPYSKFGFNEPLAAALIALAMLLIVTGIRQTPSWRMMGAGFAFGAALLTRHELALVGAPLALWVVLADAPDVKTRARRLLWFMPGAVTALVIWLTYNAARFGNPFDAGQLRDPVHGLGSPIIPGLLGLLFSPSASIFLYSPVAIFGLWGLWRGCSTRAWRCGGALAVIATVTLFYATMGNWVAGRSYGSRYLFVTLPLLGVGWAVWLAGRDPRTRRLWFASVTLIGFLLQIPAVTVDYAKISQAEAARRGGVSTEAHQWSWRVSALALNSRALPQAVRDNAAYLVGWRNRPAIASPRSDADRSFSQQFAFSLDLWWLYLFYLGVLSRAAVFAVIGVALVLIVLSATRLRAAIRESAT